MLVIMDSFLYLHSRPLLSLQFPVLAAPALKRRARSQGGFWIPPSLSLHHIQPASVACASPPGGPSALALSPGCLSLSGAPRLWLAPQSQLK